MARRSANGNLAAAVKEFMRLASQKQRHDDVTALREALAAVTTRWDRDTARAALLPHVSRLYGCPLVEGQTRATGKLVLQREAPEYWAAQKALWRMVSALFARDELDTEPAVESISTQIARGVAALVKRYGADPSTRRLLRKNLKEALDSL